MIQQQDVPRLITKVPLGYHIMIILIPAAFIFFLTAAIKQRLDPGQATFCFIIFTVIIYACFGRYLAKIVLYGNRVEVKYLFPWNRPLTFEFKRLSEMENEGISSFRQSYPGHWWYRGYKWLYLKNEQGASCRINYNINDSDDALLVNELKKFL
jgi:hypothetical protein